jgi:hypothetical protein
VRAPDEVGIRGGARGERIGEGKRREAKRSEVK